MVPNKIVTFRRWEVIFAFVVLTLAFTGMGLWLSHQNDKLNHQNKVLQIEVRRNTVAIKLIKRLRVEACRQNYRDVQGVINLFVQEQKDEHNGKLPRDDALTVLQYYRTHPADCNFLATS